MNSNEAALFLQAIARAHPGKVLVNRAIIDRWAHDLAALSVDDANTAWAHHRAHSPHPVTVSDLLGAHRRLTPSHRPELSAVAVELPPPHCAPDIAAEHLARMRAMLRHPASGSPQTPRDTVVALQTHRFRRAVAEANGATQPEDAR